MLNQNDYVPQQLCSICNTQISHLHTHRHIYSRKGDPLWLSQHIHRSRFEVSKTELEVARLIDRIRPNSLRSFDQIPMHPCDHARQTNFMKSYLKGKSVAFIGDSDSTSLVLGTLGTLGMACPSRMLLLDFDERLLQVAQIVADKHGFSSMLETRLYNVFDPLPPDLIGQFDWFYTNPPYGSHNQGKSSQLFITRGCEIVQPSGRGCIILPHDETRPWTCEAMHSTQRLLCEYGWVVSEKLDRMHRYRLDDDPDLTSAVMLIKNCVTRNVEPMPYAGRRVLFDEIPRFYGRNVWPPYPRYIRGNGILDFNWPNAEVICHV